MEPFQPVEKTSPPAGPAAQIAAEIEAPAQLSSALDYGILLWSYE